MTTIDRCIARMSTSNGLNSDECHASTGVVARTLSGLEIGPCTGGTLETWKTEVARVAQSAESRIYRIDIAQFGHSFAVAQCGGDMVVLQSWVGCYTLHDWMLGTDDKLKANIFLPSKGPTAHAVLSLYLDAISKDLLDGNIDNVYTFGLALFNPLPPRTTLLKTVLGYARGKAFSMKWASRTIVQL